MIKEKDVVFVGTKGICLVESIKKNPFAGCEKTKEYYVLKPFSSNTNMVVFLPVDTKIKIRPLISKTKAQSFLNKITEFKFSDEEAQLEASKNYVDALKDVDFERRLKILNYLMSRKKTISKKLFSVQEQKVLNSIVDCVVDELSCVLGLDKSSVQETVLSQFEENE